MFSNVATHRQNIKILLIEDQLSIRKIIQLCLSRVGGFELECVDNLSAGLSHLTKGETDLVLLDLDLPDSAGVGTFERLSKEAPGIPAVILSGSYDENLGEKLMKLGAQDYLVKGTVDRNTIVRSIRYAIVRKDMEKAIRQTELMQQREDFVAALAHDLKVPVIGAQRLLDVILSKEADGLNQQLKEVLTLLQLNNVNVLNLIDKLLEVYRYEKQFAQATLTKLDLLKLFNECIQQLAQFASDKKVEVCLEVHNQLKPITADEAAIRSLLYNLLENAIKFSLVGGKVVLSAESQDQKLVIKVRDNGIGINPKHIPKLFTRFWQGEAGKTYVASSGLGLYFCQRIVEAHQGTIKCLSQPGAGSTFVVTLSAD